MHFKQPTLNGTFKKQRKNGNQRENTGKKKFQTQTT